MGFFTSGGNTIIRASNDADAASEFECQLNGMNTGLLVVGYNYSGTSLPALDTQVTSHSGQIKLKNHSGTRLPGQV